MLDLITYVQPTDCLPRIAGSKAGTLLIIGCAACVWDDLERCDSDYQGDRMAINDMMNYYLGSLDYGVTLHPDRLTMWDFNQKYRGQRKRWPRMQTHSTVNFPRVDHVWPLHRDGGTSGLFGILIGLLMGYDRIILAGMPCDDSPRFFDPPNQKHHFYGTLAAAEEFKRALPLMQGKVSSISGNTRKWLEGC